MILAKLNQGLGEGLRGEGVCNWGGYNWNGGREIILGFFKLKVFLSIVRATHCFYKYCVI